MDKKEKKKTKKVVVDVGCSGGEGEPKGECCNVDAVVTVDGRGQIVLPKELREKAGIKAGDKFAMISCLSEGKVCCISLVRAGDFADTIKVTLGPMMKVIMG